MGRIVNGKTERERQRERENQNGCKMSNIYVRIIENKNGLQVTEQEETINRKEEEKKKKEKILQIEKGMQIVGNLHEKR